MSKVRIGIVGARSYTARELLRLLAHHDGVLVTSLMSRLEEPVTVESAHPGLRGRHFVPVRSINEEELIENADVIFLCLPHGPSAVLAKALASGGRRVIDLSADFRFRSRSLYEKTYKHEHAAPELLEESVYGLPEFWRENIRMARVVGNPGCYPTAVNMALAPIVKAFPTALPKTGIVADCKSGVSGAGRTLSERTHFVEANEGMSPYGVASHRHGPEIDTQISSWSRQALHVTFVPHLVPMDRGILATVHIPWQGEMPPLPEILEAVEAFCADEPFLRVLPVGEAPSTKAVAYTNFVDIAVAADREANLLIVMTALDNLVKGAAGQAIQNMNIMVGCAETAALL